MERHRDNRHNVEIPVYARAHPGVISSVGCLLNISVSGGFLLTTLRAALNSRISLRIIDAPEAVIPPLEGRVVRRSFAGLGIEWSEPATALVRSYTTIPAASGS